MPTTDKRKVRGENNGRVYQDRTNLSTSVVHLAEIDRWLSQHLRDNPPRVWLLSGPIGAGKTTLVQHLARQVGVGSAITSPTFSLQKSYRLKGQPWSRLVHIDAYRITSASQIAALELAEILDDRTSLVVVEWPENLPGVRWGSHLRISIAPGSTPQSRQLRSVVISS